MPEKNCFAPSLISSNKCLQNLPLEYSFMERHKIRICEILLSKLINILQIVSCCFSSYIASYVDLYNCYDGYCSI